MNITEETNDYFTKNERITRVLKGAHPFDPSKFPNSSSPLESLADVIITDLKAGDFIDKDENGAYRNYRGKSNIIMCELAEDNLKDKLKTTPDRGIKKISKVFRVDWSKVFKRGWLLWK